MIRLKHLLYMRLGVRGKNVRVLRDAHIGPFSRIWAPYDLSIGKGFYCGKFVTIECDGQIGDYVLIGNNVGIVGRNDHDHKQVGVPTSKSDWVGHSQELSSKVQIGHDVWIGFGSIILAPVQIGSFSIIAAGSVVRVDVPEFAIVAGNPAEIVGWRFTDDETRGNHSRAIEKIQSETKSS